MHKVLLQSQLLMTGVYLEEAHEPEEPEQAHVVQQNQQQWRCAGLQEDKHHKLQSKHQTCLAYQLLLGLQSQADSH